MNIDRLDLVISLFSILGLWLWSRTSRSRKMRHFPLPPGPKGLPLIGNVFDMPKDSDKEWLFVHDWGKTYGTSDMIYVENFGSPVLFLNSYQDAFELLEKRSSIYSDRPRMPMMTEIMGWDWALPFLPYAERFRKVRQLVQKFFQPAVVKEYEDLQTRETHRLLQNLLETPHEFVHHIRRTAGAVIMMITYGHEVAQKGDLFITLGDKAMSSFAQGGKSGAYLVDVLPWLKYVPAWFPGAGWKRKGLEWYKLSQSMLMTPFTMTKEKIMNGSAIPSMMSQLVESNTDDSGKIQYEEIIASSTAIAYAGGADTTVSSLLSVILAILLFPEVQERAHEEIDRVVGKGRLPTFEDRESLPFIEGMIREALRWNPVVPLNTPHRLMTDDVYKGYFIPAGCSVIANQWSFLHDEKEYPDPMIFRPERWLQNDQQDGPRHSNKATFGFGRRLCPGRHLVNQSLFIGISNLLAVFNIERALDKNGKPIIPTAEYYSGLISYPKPFECSITPRSPDAVALILQTMENTE